MLDSKTSLKFEKRFKRTKKAKEMLSSMEDLTLMQ